MRRFSQRNNLVTLSDINITPLLDLAFVLLIIFVITTPALTQSINLKLPSGGRPDKKAMDARDVKTVEITSKGQYVYERKPSNPDLIESSLVQFYKANPNLVVVVRADEDGPLKYTTEIINRCQRNQITSFSIRTLAPKK